MKGLRAYILPLIVFLLGGCATDNTPKPTPLSPTVPTALAVKVLWKRAVSDGNEGHNLTIGSTLQGNTLVTAGYNGEVIALNVENGETLWQTDLKDSITATPGVNAHTVFVGTLKGELYALDLQNGSIKWHHSLPSILLSPPAAVEDTVVVQCHDASVLAFSTANGDHLWTYQASSPALTLYGNSSPVIDGGKVYVGFDSGQLGAFDLYQGIEIWQIPLALPASTEAVENMVDIDGTPVLESGILFSTSYHGMVSAVNLSSGQMIWQKKASSFEALAVQNNRVILVDETGEIRALDESSGATLWQQKSLLYRFVSPPAVFNNLVVVGDYEGDVHFLSLNDGSLMARIQVAQGGIRAMPLVIGNRIIITTNEGEVVLLQPLL